MIKTNGLTPRMERFLTEYLKDFDGKAAAIRTGYSTKRAAITASEILAKPKCQEWLASRRKVAETKAELSAIEVLKELQKVAFANITDVAVWEGDGLVVRNTSDLPPEALAAIGEIVEVEFEGGRRLKVKMHDKVKALDMLMKHLGLYEKNGHQLSVNAQALQININKVNATSK